ncbi:MAG: hypothetical protein AABW59_04695 [archaeon]
MKSEISTCINSAKRSCVLCHTYRNLKPSVSQKDMATVATRRAYDILKDAFEELRKRNAPIDQLEKVKAAKVLCLDATDACDSCDKQRPRIKEILVDVK